MRWSCACCELEDSTKVGLISTLDFEISCLCLVADLDGVLATVFRRGVLDGQRETATITFHLELIIRGDLLTILHPNDVFIFDVSRNVTLKCGSYFLWHLGISQRSQVCFERKK